MKKLTVLEKILSKRYYTHSLRSKEFNIEMPTREVWYQVLSQQLLDNNGKCHYCNFTIDLNGIDFKMVLSVDHKVPLSNMGDNSPDNLIVCCYRCNLAKGVMSASIFYTVCQVLKNTSEGLLESFLNENFNASLAHKIERRTKEKEV